MTTIEVTQDDIDHGTRGSCNTCPVARAIKRATGFHNLVSARNVLAYNRERSTRPTAVNLPIEALRFINDFDCHHPVQPFSFELDL